MLKPIKEVKNNIKYIQKPNINININDKELLDKINNRITKRT